MANEKRGRARKSIEQLKLEGLYRPDRHDDTSPKPKGVPIKPEHLAGAAGELWDYITPKLIELNIATDLDTHALAALCEWWGEYDDARRERVEYGKGLSDLARAINKLADSVFVTEGKHLDTLERLSCDIGHILDRGAVQAKRKVDRMKIAWTEFSKIAGRFGMTPVDRRAMRDVTTETRDDPLTAYLKERQELGRQTPGDG